MAIEFPEIRDWTELLKAIEGKDEISGRAKDGYVVYDYDYQGRDTFVGSPLLRECRGIKFLPSGALLARPFHKFFNYGEHPEGDALDVGQIHQVSDKLDGSMIHPMFLGKELVFCTRAGITDHALAALSIATASQLSFCREMLPRFTPIFEWISPRNRIVLPYEKDSLVLLAVRENLSGDYLPRDVLESLARLFSIPLVPCWDHSIHNLAALATTIREMQGKEGYVVQQGNLLVKIKTEDYVLKHRTKDELSQERHVLRVILEEKLDDILPLVDEEYRERLLRYQGAVRQGLAATKARLTEILGRTYTDRKSFALAHKDDPAFPVLARAFGKSSGPAIESYILEHLTSNERAGRVRHLIGDPQWNE